MRLLLDTHAWLWFFLGDDRLSSRAKASILDPGNTSFVSPASYWEISIKISLGKYVLALPYQEFMRQAIAGSGFGVVPISPRHTEFIARLPFHHRDPFDRLLVAQAVIEGMILVSSDPQLSLYGTQPIW